MNGYAIVETETGRIIKTVLSGEFDMLSFYSEVKQGDEEAPTLIPTQCTTAATFKFMGNRVSTVFNSMYHQPYTLPDSIDEQRSKELIMRQRQNGNGRLKQQQPPIPPNIR